MQMFVQYNRKRYALPLPLRHNPPPPPPILRSLFESCSNPRSMLLLHSCLNPKMHMITESRGRAGNRSDSKDDRVSGDFRMNSKDVESGFRTGWKGRAGQNKIIIAIGRTLYRPVLLSHKVRVRPLLRTGPNRSP